MAKTTKSGADLALLDKRAPTKINRRLKRISIDPRTFLDMLRPGSFKWATAGIPVDVEYLGVTFDAPSGTWQIFITHPSFDEVPEATVIPQAVVEIRTERIEING